MNIPMLQNILVISAVINFGILLLWFAVFTLAPALVYKTHGTWLKISNERMGEIHYTGMLLFKLAIFFFNIVPYIALRIIE